MNVVQAEIECNREFKYMERIRDDFLKSASKEAVSFFLKRAKSSDEAVQKHYGFYQKHLKSYNNLIDETMVQILDDCILSTPDLAEVYAIGYRNELPAYCTKAIAKCEEMIAEFKVVD